MERATTRWAAIAATLLLAPLAPRAPAAEPGLYEQVMALDSALFDRGFNHCDMAALDGVLADDLEFYHDQGGPTLGKAAFVADFKSSLCRATGAKPIRRLIPESTRVYPLLAGGKLYGAVQEGSHSFYEQEAEGTRHLTSTAQFVHLWLKTPSGWRLKRALSIDHVPAAGVPPAAQADYPARVFDDDKRLEAMLAQHHIPSMANADIEHGQLRSVRVVGELTRGRPAPMDAIYDVASLTKPVTALTVLRLVDAGQWQLDEPLSRDYVDPDLAGDPRVAALTTRQVLSHRSGLPNWRRSSPNGRLAFEFDPGSRQQYSGEGFEILRRALEARFHCGLEVLARRWVFEPAGMRETHFGWSDAVDADRYAIPHDAAGEPMAVTHPAGANAADHLLTTAGDYGRFLAWVSRGAGLSAGILADMQKPQGDPAGDLPFGLGWQLVALPDGTQALQHSGSDPGVNTLAVVLPSRQAATLVFENSDNGPATWKKYLEEVWGPTGAAIAAANLAPRANARGR